jgi:hypothetical protein
MQLTDMGMTGMGQMDAGQMGTDSKDKHRKGADSVGRGCEPLIGTGDCAES